MSRSRCLFCDNRPLEEDEFAVKCEKHQDLMTFYEHSTRLSKEPVPRQVRNPEACCDNCPYGFKPSPDDPFLSTYVIENHRMLCCKNAQTSMESSNHPESFVCGDHPEFWIIEVKENE